MAGPTLFRLVKRTLSAAVICGNTADTLPRKPPSGGGESGHREALPGGVYLDAAGPVSLAA